MWAHPCPPLAPSPPCLTPPPVTAQVVRLTWLNEGVRGFYKGLGPALLRVMPQSAVTLVVYEKVLAVLKAS